MVSRDDCRNLAVEIVPDLRDRAVCCHYRATQLVKAVFATVFHRIACKLCDNSVTCDGGSVRCGRDVVVMIWQ